MECLSTISPQTSGVHWLPFELERRGARGPPGPRRGMPDCTDSGDPLDTLPVCCRADATATVAKVSGGVLLPAFFDEADATAGACLYFVPVERLGLTGGW